MVEVTGVRFSSFPRTKPPPPFVFEVVSVFQQHEAGISTMALLKGLESDDVLHVVGPALKAIGFETEAGKSVGGRLSRPVFFGEGGAPTLRYEIDGYQPVWRCGLEIEAGRAIMANAIFRDLFQAMVMVDIDHLCLAVPIAYKYKHSGKSRVGRCYDQTLAVANALYGHTRMTIPYGLTVIGY